MDLRTSQMIDPAIYRRNLDALSRRQSGVAEQIQALALSEKIECVTGRDGSPTFRIPGTDGNLIWLGHSSMPSVSSPAVLADFEMGTTNALLPSFGHGGEVRHLLSRMQPHQAVFTWDAEPQVPALGMRLNDFSADILCGRLVLTIDASPKTALLTAFEDYKTHLPPAKIFSAPHLRPEDIHLLQTEIESAASAQQQALTVGLSKARDGLAQLAPRSDKQRRSLAIISTIVDQRLSNIAVALQRATSDQEIDRRVHLADGPARVHLRALAEFLLEQRPDTVVLLNQARSELGPLLDDVSRCTTWCVTDSAAREQLTKQLSDAILPVSSVKLRQRIEESAGRPLNIEIVGPAADATVFCRHEPSSGERDHFGSDVAIIQDAAPLSADSMGLKWDSHKKLFDTIVALIRQDPRRLSARSADALFERACRKTKITLDAPDLIREMQAFMIEHLAPTLSTLELLKLLRTDGIVFKLWGSNWNLHEEAASAAQLPAPTSGQRNLIYNSGAIVPHLRGDQFDEQHLIEALAAGACVLRQRHPDRQDRETSSWPEVTDAVMSFDDLPGCATLLRSLLQDDSKRGEANSAACKLVREKHLAQHRIRALGCF